MDENGRLLPATNKFPSAAEGKGFKPLADYVHGKGLKFGIHLMRGIPRQAVERNTPVLGTSALAVPTLSSVPFGGLKRRACVLRGCLTSSLAAFSLPFFTR